MKHTDTQNTQGMESKSGDHIGDELVKAIVQPMLYIQFKKTPKSLIVCCFHSKDAITLPGISKPAVAVSLVQKPPFDVNQHHENIYGAIKSEIDKQLKTMAPAPQAIIFVGDVNLGFYGENYPNFLAESRLEQDYPGKMIFKNLLSATAEVVEKAIATFTPDPQKTLIEVKGKQLYLTNFRKFEGQIPDQAKAPETLSKDEVQATVKANQGDAPEVAQIGDVPQSILGTKRGASEELVNQTKFALTAPESDTGDDVTSANKTAPLLGQSMFEAKPTTGTNDPIAASPTVEKVAEETVGDRPTKSNFRT